MVFVGAGRAERLLQDNSTPKAGSPCRPSGTAGDPPRATPRPGLALPRPRPPPRRRSGALGSAPRRLTTARAVAKPTLVPRTGPEPAAPPPAAAAAAAHTRGQKAAGRNADGAGGCEASASLCNPRVSRPAPVYRGSAAGQAACQCTAPPRPAPTALARRRTGKRGGCNTRRPQPPPAERVALGGAGSPPGSTSLHRGACRALSSPSWALRAPATRDTPRGWGPARAGGAAGTDTRRELTGNRAGCTNSDVNVMSKGLLFSLTRARRQSS